MCHQGPLPALLPLLSERLQRKVDSLRSKIIMQNYNTRFAQTASQLSEFRDVTADLVDDMDDKTLSACFCNTVPLTTYDSYASLMTRFLDKPCKVGNIADLFAPGLPDYICRSSSTSGSVPKVFPKYNRLPKIPSDVGLHKILVSMRKRTTAFIVYLWCEPIHIEDENDHPVMYLSPVSVMHHRTPLNLHPEEDDRMMGMFMFDHAAPYAAGFIRQWRTFLFIHALFAISSRSLETMTMSFISTFVDMMRYLDTDFDMVVDCIANGTVPDLDGVTKVRHYLEINISPDPKRAEELRNFGRPSSRSGWCALVWPNLHSVVGIASGSFAPYVPLAEWFLGSNAKIRPNGYPATEARIGWSYDLDELNQIKISTDDIIEFLDVAKSDSINALVQAWEVEPGKPYEIVLTTHDGLWRYRLGDVVEVAGFDPADGVPIIKFKGRRNMAIRLPGAVTFNEEDLTAAISCMATSMATKVVGWTATVDTRLAHSTVGFFVEVAAERMKVSDLELAMRHLIDMLSPSKRAMGQILPSSATQKPTIWLVRCGTFSDFRQLKLDEGETKNVGQVKIPVVLPKPEYVAWFLDRMVQEV